MKKIFLYLSSLLTIITFSCNKIENNNKAGSEDTTQSVGETGYKYKFVCSLVKDGKKYDCGPPEGDNIGKQCLIWTTKPSISCTPGRWICARVLTV